MTDINDIAMHNLVAENKALKAYNQELRGSIMLSNDRLDALWINTGSLGCKSQLDSNIAILVKTPKQCLNSVKADAIDLFTHFVIESGELSACDNKFLVDYAKEFINEKAD